MFVSAGSVVDEFVEEMKEIRTLTRHMLHLLILPSTLSIYMGHGNGHIQCTVEWVEERCRVSFTSNLSFILSSNFKLENFQ